MRRRVANSVLSLCVILGVIAAGASTGAQEPKKAAESQRGSPKKEVDWNALFRMHYENRVRSFREQNLIFRNVVLVGDSITEGFDVTKYFPGRRVLNRGIGGDVIGNALPDDDPRGLLKRLDSSIFDCAATEMFLLIGINDLNGGRTVSTMEAGYRELLRRIKERAPGVRVHVESLLPTRGEFAKHNRPVREFNLRLAQMAKEFGYPFMDLHRVLSDADGQLKSEFTADGLHLTAAAYDVWRAEVEKAMAWRPAAGK